MTVQSIFSAQGQIAVRHDRYEDRPEQRQMAQAVERAIAEETHLLVEAGTGVGKSFAYLVPSILAATQSPHDDEHRTRIVISTNTISLQEQLISRDIPFLNAVLPVEFSAVLVKGRSNYASLRRVKGALEKASSLFSRDEELVQLQKIVDWSNKTHDGSLADLDFRPHPTVWDEVASEHGNCLGRKCATYNQCFYYRARRRVWNADLLVVNHALFFSDLALRREGASILPDYDVVVFDEAHTIEAVASDHLGIAISSGQMEYWLNRLYNDRTNRGLLVRHHLTDEQQLVAEIRFRQADLFFALRNQHELAGKTTQRIRTLPNIENDVSPLLRRLAASISAFAKTLEPDEERVELTAAADRCVGLASSLESWLTQSMEDAAYWVELTGRRRQSTKLVSAPIDVGPVLRDELFNQVKTVILTSATLAVGKENFEFAKSRLGLTQTSELKLGSPFNYRQQVRLVLPQEMPDPSADPNAYEKVAIDKIRKYIAQTDGHAFVLFTSYKMLKACASRLTPWLSERNMALYAQGEGVSRSLMLERFRKNPRAVLLGTDSFWQGVDVPGDALQNVIIAKLPFSVPDHPLLEARLEAIRERGGNPFMDFQIPEAIIKLKQGFGRLIRTKTDTGQVVILDPRVRTKRYGRLFLESLPDCEIIMDEA
ncbi:MAG: helicase C-terminal domain-containing protein [Planctomycetaceae bacterium]